MVTVIIYALIMFGIFIWLIVETVLRRRKLLPYLKYGLVCGATLIVLDLAVLSCILSASKNIPPLKLVTIFFLNIFVFIRTVLYTIIGMYSCSKIRSPHLPLLRRLFRKNSPPSQKFITRSYMLTNIGLVLSFVVYSVILFKIISPKISEFLENVTQTKSAQYGVSNSPSVLTTLVVIEFAFAEEIIFRLGIQNLLAKTFRLSHKRYWIAVVLTAALWSLAHAHIINPAWVKIAQVFPLGIALGFLCKKYGVENSILAHGVFNVIMMFLSHYLIY